MTRMTGLPEEGEDIITTLVNNSLTTYVVVNGNINSDRFNTWLEKIPIIELPENSVIIMDNTALYQGRRLS